MSIAQLFEVLLAVSVAVFCLCGVIPEFRHYLALRRSRNWPLVHGSIQKGETLQPNSGKYMQLPWRIVLGYKYVVNGCPHFGFAAVAAEDMYAAEKLGKQADGRVVSVKYDPENPGISVLVEREIDGRPVKQDPMWLDG
jgi:hypothetical protein